MKKKYPNWIDGYSQAIYKLSESHDPTTHLPFDGFEIMPLYAELWIDYFYNAIQKFQKLNLTIKDAISFLPVHSSMKFNLFELAYMFKIAKSNHKIVKTIVNFFVEAIEYRAASDSWWENNIIKEYINVTNIVKEKKLIKAETEIARTVAKISAGCGMLVHGLYNDFATDYGYDVFGPYDTKKIYGKDTSLWIKKFADLNPIEIWPSRKDFPYKTINIFSIYKNLDSESYYIGCHMNYKQNLIEHISHLQVEIDGFFITDLDELNKVRDIILKDASDHFIMYKQLDFEKQKEIWLWQMCYQFKNFFKFLDLDWKPTKTLLNSVKGKKLVSYYSKEDKLNPQSHAEMFGTNYLKAVYSR